MSLEKPLSMKEGPERGKRVKIVIKFQRHGLRDGRNLIDEGRDITRTLAEQSGWYVEGGREGIGERFDAAKAIGSPADTPVKTEENPRPLSRALETADITARTIAGERATKTKLNEKGEEIQVDTWNPRPEERLSYVKRRTPAPYNHLEMYNAALAKAIERLGNGKTTQEELTLEEKIKVTEEVQTEVVEHAAGLTTPLAEQFKKEAAGAFADLIEHYIDMTKYLKNDSNVLYAAGTHGGTIEWLLQKALVWTDAQGNTKIGYGDPDEIGGVFQSSEAYNLVIETDDEGNLKEMKVMFDTPARNTLVKEAHFDLAAIDTLAEDYRALQVHCDHLDELNKAGDEGAFDAYKQDNGVFYDWDDTKTEKR